MASPADLYLAAAEYLAACAEAVADAPGGPIARAFVSPGPPAWDCCPQLTVHCAGVTVADTSPLQPYLSPGHRLQKTGTVWLAPLVCTVIRCVPVAQVNGGNVSFPSASTLDAVAQVTNGDLWSIWNRIASMVRDGTLFQPREREVMLDPPVPLGPQGGCAGWQIQVRANLGGYKADA